jgi:predicted DCC family thiol-disulfide oxidoreductase YuxK
MSTLGQHVVLFYDGECVFCTASARLGRRLKLRAEFLPLQSVDLSALGVDPERVRHEVALRREDGSVLYGHRAIAGVLTTGLLPARLVGGAMTWGPFDRISAWGYRMVSTHRPELSRGITSCRHAFVTLKEVISGSKASNR